MEFRDGTVKSVVIDKFVNKVHGPNLSQHRYQPEKNVILILDEAHQPEAITDNLYKISQKIIFQFASSAVSRILVTATPMQSERPVVQLWNFGRLFNKDDYESIKTMYKQAKTNKEFKHKIRIVDFMKKKVSRSFEMQPLQRKLFLQNILGDNYLLDKFDEILRLHNWDDKTLKMPKLHMKQKRSMLKNLGRSMFSVTDEDGFKNPFPAKLAMFTPYDNGRIRSYMDGTRCNICRYAERDSNSIYFDFRTRNKPKQYVGDLQYDQYLINKDDRTTINTFDKEMSDILYSEYNDKFIPIVMKRYKDFQTQKQNDEVDGRIMEKLQKYAFSMEKGPLIFPILADNLAEAHDALGKHVLRRYTKSFYVNKEHSPVVRASARIQNQNMPRELQEYVDSKSNVQKAAKWFDYKRNEHGMPFVPNLISSKYKDIVNTLIKADSDHTNGMIFHRNYSVHYTLAETMEAYGSRKLDVDVVLKRGDLKGLFIENAARKIINKWKMYQGQDMYLHANDTECRGEGEKVKWSPQYEIKNLKKWGISEECRDGPLIHYKTFKSKRMEAIQKMIRELGDRVEEMWKEETDKKGTLIEYVMYRDMEYKHYVEKVWKLSKPVPISNSGVWDVINDDGEQETVYEGRNGTGNRGASGDFKGYVIVPATSEDFKYYVTQVLFKKIEGGKIKVPRTGNKKVGSALISMLEYTMETYDSTKTDHDRRFKLQQNILRLVKESGKFEIFESYTKDALTSTAIQLQGMVENLEKYETTEFSDDDHNGVVNKRALQFVRQLIVINPKDYQSKNPTRPFSEVMLRDYVVDEKEFMRDEQAFKKELSSDMRKLSPRGRNWFVSEAILKTVDEFSNVSNANVSTQKERFEHFRKIHDKEELDMKTAWENDLEAFDTDPSIKNLEKLKNNPYMRTFNTVKKSNTWNLSFRGSVLKVLLVPQKRKYR